MDRAYLLNNPFTFQAMEARRLLRRCRPARPGMPATWLLPHKVRRGTSARATATSATTGPSTCRRVGEAVGYRCT